MRISVRKGDRGYHPEASKCRVYLNGKRIREGIFTADEDIGVVYCYKTNSKGGYIISPRSHEVETMAIHGSVVIKNKPKGEYVSYPVPGYDNNVRVPEITGTMSLHVRKSNE